jgi:hypothetical protein
MLYIVAIATLVSLPVSEHLIKKKGFSYPRAMTISLLICWVVTLVLSLIVKWLFIS